MLEFFSHHKGTSGVISVMLALLLLPIYSLTALLMEAARVRSAQEQLDELNGVGCMAVLADYMSYLEDDFGLYGVDTTDWTGDISSASFDEYISFCETNGGVDTRNLNKLFGISESDCSIEGMYTLADPEVLKLQIKQYGKFILPATAVCDLTLSSLFKEIKDFFDGITDKIEDMSNIADAGSKVGEASISIDELTSAIDDLENEYNKGDTNYCTYYTTLTSGLGNITLPSENNSAYYFYYDHNDSTMLVQMKKFLEDKKDDINTNYFNSSDQANAKTKLSEDEITTLTNAGDEGGFKSSEEYTYSEILRTINETLNDNNKFHFSGISLNNLTTYNGVISDLEKAISYADFYKQVNNENINGKWDDLLGQAEALKDSYGSYSDKYSSLYDNLKDLADSLEEAQESMKNIAKGKDKEVDYTTFEEQSKALTDLIGNDLKNKHKSHKNGLEDNYTDMKNKAISLDKDNC